MSEPIDEKELEALYPLAAKALRALKEAVAAAIAEHWRAGRPVSIWRDGQVMALYEDGTCIPAQEVPNPPAPLPTGRRKE
jgi:hypothetical protein